MPQIGSLLAHKFEGFQVDTEPVSPHAPVASPIKRSPFLRCPIPPLSPISVDNLDQYNLHGLVPQYRVLR